MLGRTRFSRVLRFVDAPVYDPHMVEQESQRRQDLGRLLWDVAGPEQWPTLRVLADSSDPIAPQVLQGLLQRVAMTAMPGAMARGGMEEVDRWSGGLTERPTSSRGRGSGAAGARGGGEPGEPRQVDYEAVPRVVFTDPQAAAVGATEAPYSPPTLVPTVSRGKPPAPSPKSRYR